MKNDCVTEKTYTPFCTMALAVPAMEAAVGQNWLPSLIVGIGALLVCIWMGRQKTEPCRWLAYLRIPAIVLLLGVFLRQMHQCWPGKWAEYAIPGALLIMAVYSAGRGTAVASRSANVLRYGMYIVLGGLLLLGIGEVHLRELAPRPELPSAELALVLLLPLLARKGEKGKAIPLLAVVLPVTIVTAGKETINLYQFSRGISINGVTEHMESLTACALTVGYYGLISYMMDCLQWEWGNAGRSSNVFLLPAAAAGAFALCLLEPWLKMEGYLLMVLVLWLVLPILGALKRKLEKTEKSA